MEGGRLVGSPGSFGCAFTPPLLCLDGQDKKKQRKVGKITEKKYGLKEIAAATRLRHLPLAPNYFYLTDPEFCKPLPADAQTDPDFERCYQSGIYKKKEKDIIQIFMPLGGKNLFSADTHPSRFDFYSFMRHLLEAGASLCIAGVIHFDIHPANILLDGRNVPRLIDFGLSFLSDTISDDTWLNLYRVLAEKPLGEVIANAEAPELFIINRQIDEMPVAEAIQIEVGRLPIVRDMNNLLSVSKDECVLDFLEFWRRSKSAQQRDWTLFWKLYWPAFDAWSIGALLLNLLRKQRSMLGFDSGLWNERKMAVENTLRGLLDFDVRRRLDCVEALSVYDPENAWLKRFGATWLKRKNEQRAVVGVLSGGDPLPEASL